MAKGRRRKKPEVKRDPIVIATVNPTVLQSRPPVVKADRRTFHPLGRAASPAVTVSGRPARVTAAPTKSRVVRGPGGRPLRSGRVVVARSSTRPPKLRKVSIREVWAFHNPKHVWVCIKRKMRRQVLHALGRTGRGARSRKRFNSYSEVRC